MSGIKYLLRSFNDTSNRNLTYYNINLYLRKQICFYLHTTIIFRLTLLNTATQNMGYCHTCNTKLHHGCLQCFKSGFLTNNLNLSKLRCTLIKGRNLLNRNCFCYRSISGYNNRLTSLFNILRLHCKSCICRRQTMFCYIKTKNLFFTVNTKSHNSLNNKECNCNGYCGPRSHTDKSYKLKS